MPVAATTGAAGSGRPTITRHFYSLDLTRFLAAFAVMIFHYAYYASNGPYEAVGLRAAIGASVESNFLTPFARYGFLGVEIFFFISGFTISWSIAGQTAFGFFRARIIRLLPAYWTFVCACLLVTLLYSTAPRSEIVQLFVNSLTLVPAGPWLDPVYWTLVVEASFYLSILCLLTARRIEWLEPLAHFWAWVCLGLLGTALLPPLHDQRYEFLVTLASQVRSLPAEITPFVFGPYFALGIAVCFMVRCGATRMRVLSVIVAALGSAIAAYFATDDGITCLAVWSGAMLLTAAALFAEVRYRPAFSQFGALIRVLGLLSYPLYLVHGIIGAWVLGRLMGMGLTQTEALFGAGCFSIVTAAAFTTTMEPALQRWLGGAVDRVRGVSARSH